MVLNDIVKLSKDVIKALVPDTGTTVNAYVTVTDMDTRWLGELDIIISNTAADHGMTYQILVYNDYANGIAYIISTDAIAASANVNVLLGRHARVVVQLKSTVTDDHTTYQVDAIGGR